MRNNKKFILISLFTLTFLNACATQSSSKTSDAILSAIEARELAKYDITAETFGRTATLSGFVSSLSDKQMAESATLETGLIDKVENNLKITSSIDFPKTDEPALNTAALSSDSPEALAESVLINIKNSGKIQAYHIDAYPKNDMVYLRGTVDNEKDLSSLNQLISDSIHNQKIVNQVSIRPPLTDEELLMRAQENLLKNQVINAKVSVTNRILTVSGDFPSFEEADRALTSLVGLQDLKGLVSNVTVREAAYPIEKFRVK